MAACGVVTRTGHQGHDCSYCTVQAQLTDSLYGVNRGLDADSELRAEISELISALEARNPTEAPNDVSARARLARAPAPKRGRPGIDGLCAAPLTQRPCTWVCTAQAKHAAAVQAADLLNGTWNLQYTANSELFSLLALSRLPFVDVGPIQQIIDTGTMTARNKVCTACLPCWAAAAAAQPGLTLAQPGSSGQGVAGRATARGRPAAARPGSQADLLRQAWQGLR